MKPKVCVLAEANVYNWTPYYIEAFRACCEVVTVGPTPDAETLASWGRGGVASHVVPNDIVVDFDGETDLETLLPPQWEPDLVVGISGMGGRPLYGRVGELPWPTAFITIDTWQCLMDYVDAVPYDFVFVAQEEFAPHLRAVGAPRVQWLPLGCSARYHQPTAGAPDHDFAFVGTLASGIHDERCRLLSLLNNHFSLYARPDAFGEDACAVMGRGRLAFNHCAVQEVNMRVFETLAMGRPLLTNREAQRNGLLKLFSPDEHLIVYADQDDLLRKTQEYLGDEQRRENVARRGYEEVLARHTYRHRVDALLETVQTALDTETSPPRRPLGTPAGCLPLLPGRIMDEHGALDHGAFSAAHRVVHRSNEPCDTVVLASPPLDAENLDQAIAAGHASLTTGGTLMLVLEQSLGLPGDREALRYWFLSKDLHLVARHCLEGGTTVLLARKRRERLSSVVETVFREHPETGIDPVDIQRRLPDAL